MPRFQFGNQNGQQCRFRADHYLNRLPTYFYVTGIEGKMFKPMAQTVAFALIGAFLLSLTYIPMMSSLVLSRKKKRKTIFLTE
jgi:Cu/Ag efflux pump CusA